MTEEIRRIIETENVWARNVELFRSQEKQLIVPEDRSPLENIKRKFPDFYNSLKLNLIPDPIAANIDAPVCTILLNPGYSAIDEYNFRDVSNGVKQGVINECANFVANKKPQPCDVEFLFRDPEEEKKMLKRRQNVLLDNFLLKPGASHYALDPSFNTVRLTERNTGRVSRRLFGSYMWELNFLRHITNRNAFFNIEFFPYHSRNFNFNRYIEIEKDKDCRVAHCEFRNHLICQMSRENRIFIVRSETISNYLTRELKVPQNQILLLSNPRMAMITRRLKGDKDTVRRAIDLLGIRDKK